MTAQPAPQPTRTRSEGVRVYVGSEGFITSTRSDSELYPADIYIRDAAHDTLVTLHLSREGLRQVRDATTRLLVSLEADAIEAAGFIAAAEAQEVAALTYTRAPERSYPEALTIVQNFSGNAAVNS